MATPCAPSERARSVGHMDTFDFAPRHAIVTASDSGIGQATALALADAGLDVGITWHSDEEGAERTADAVRERGQRRRGGAVRRDQTRRGRAARSTSSSSGSADSTSS